MAGEALNVAVVGHTNTGKTSLMRTLLRDTQFGEVRDAPATTRHVEAAQLLVDDQPVLCLYDTPGLEDASGILDWLELNPGERGEGASAIRRFLADPAAGMRFEQEAKVLRQLMASDVGLYVIDAREPVLPKYRDELAVLSQCARPLLPLLNYVSAESADTQTWRSALAELGLHAVVAFDTVVFDAAGERALFEKLISVLDAHREPLSRLLALREREARLRLETACQLIADMLIDVAAALVVLPEGDGDAAARAWQQLQDRVREREQVCIDRLLELFAFGGVEHALTRLPLEQGRWELDLFTPEAMREYGVQTGKGLGVGAAAGLAVDALSAGLTLGAGTATGAAIGAVIANRRGLVRRLWHRALGQMELRIDDATLRVLALRELALLKALERRGHGAVAPVATGQVADKAPLERLRGERLPADVDRARVRPDWSALNREVYRSESVSRAEASRRLGRLLLAER